MTERVQPTGAMSQKGWIRVDYDRSVWIPCLPVFPEGENRESWAAGFAELWWEGSGLEHGKHEVALLERNLLSIHEYAYSHLPCHMAVIHLPDPRLVPLLVCFAVLPAEGDRAAQLRTLAHADEPGVVEPPIVSDCTTEKLGTGLKVLFYKQEDNDGSGIFAALNYAWRSENYETAVRMFVACPDLGRLQRAMPDLDKLAQVITVVPRNPSAVR